MTRGSFQDRVLNHIRRHNLIKEGDQVLAGVSGGADSVALLHVLFSLRDELGITGLSVLHFNHCLRFEASDLDETFVKSLAERFRLPFFSRREDVKTTSIEQGISLEMAARICRHQFFRDHMRRFESGKLVLAHTANDQAEEVLLRMFRGTGPSGSGGMAVRTPGNIVRPLLFAQRAEILDYLETCRIGFREDASNLEPFCQRNSLRLNLFPILEKIFHGSIVEVLTRHADLVRDEENFWVDQVRHYWKTICAEESPSRLVLKTSELSALPTALRRRTLRYALGQLQGDLSGIYAVHVEALERLLERSTSGKSIHLPKGMRAGKEGGFITLSKGQSEAEEFSCNPWDKDLVIERSGVYEFRGFDLQVSVQRRTVEIIDSIHVHSRYRAFMDAGKITWPLIVRTWKPGDRFQPLGSHGTKKLQDFFTDSKIPRRQREQIPLLCDREKICWIMGLRLDEGVKVTPETQYLVIVEGHPSAKQPS